MSYLRRFLDASDPTASLKHAAYALVVCSAVGWLTWDLVHGPITPDWNIAFGMLVASVTTGKVVGAAASPAPSSVVSGNAPAGSDKL